VKLDKLLKRLKRDAAASPQKAGALGLMVVVALYFWAPLVMKYLPKGKPKPGATVAGPVILGDDPVLVKAAVHPSTNSTHWDRVREVVAKDRLMLAAEFHRDWHNPFSPLQHDDEPKSKSEPKSEAIKSDLKPLPTAPKIDSEIAKQQLSTVSLSSVLVGKRGVTAVIRGRLYRVGDVLSFGGDNGTPAVEFRITAIDEQGVDLKYDNKPFRLERPKPTLTTGELQRGES
jgi:hypothetical protein